METNWAEDETDWQIICCGYVFQGKQFFLSDRMNLLVSMLAMVVFNVNLVSVKTRNC